jgi:hypothetical protein
MSFSVLDIASMIAAGSLAVSKIITAAQPLWAKLPRWLAVALPVLVLDLPQVAAAFGLVQTGTSITTAIITSLALLAPGLAEAETSKEATVAVAAARDAAAATVAVTTAAANVVKAGAAHDAAIAVHAAAVEAAKPSA